ncbi:CDP-glycerol glycerophosphotransferase family protein [Vagococcus fluvialis]|uniref:CDP-glycerol glycerophosphotransferase family protein n=1 Tax=Vagococcus fluvialis TaxID=2738 RepID=UPI003D0E373B
MISNKVKNNFKKIKGNLFPSQHQKLRLYYAENYESKPIDEKLIVYETRDGKSIVDSPYAMFLELATNPDYTEYKHLWIINNEVEGIKESIPKELRELVSFVERGTIEYVDALLRAKYIISNSTLESFFVKREKQVYINTWHGTPLKHMGFDIPGFVNHSQNVLRNFLMADFIISPNNHTSNIFINSYKLKGIYPGEILEGGYPRIDLILNTSKKEVVEKIKKYEVDYLDELPTLLFCPTWKGSSVNDAEDDVDQIIKETLSIKEKFSNEYNVLVKVHPFIFSKVKEDERISKYLISDLIDANEVLSICDLIVTDYSSIFFDYLVTKKPIIFYAWDKDLYEENRGMYLSEDELPGPTAENLSELFDFIENIAENKKNYQSKYDHLAKKMVEYEDGNVTKKYIDYIFKGIKQEKLLIKKVDSNKKKIIIYPGGMKNNGITSSLLNLVNNIDYDKFDVTIVTNSSRNQEINNNLKALNPNARVLFRFGVNILTKQERKIDKKFMENGVSFDNRRNYPTLGYQREMNRIVSNLSFDVAIDFSGYSYFWGRHILATKSKKYVAFMHNDLMSDSLREINGKTPMKNDLHGLFSIYYKFDKLLSVSPMTQAVNAENLKEFVTDEQMSYVYNSINIDQILNSKNLKEDDSKLESSIKINKTLELVNKSNEVKVFKNIEEIKNNSFKNTTLIEGNKVVSHAVFVYEEIEYKKVSIEGEYVGWIISKVFSPRPLVVEKIENSHFYGTVSRDFNYPIWKELKTNTEVDQVVTYARYFRKKYLEVTKVAYTENGRYFLVNYLGKEIGWMSSRPLMRLHKVDPLKVIHFYFSNKMKAMNNEEPVVYSTSVTNDIELFGKLRRDESILLTTVPSIVIGAVEVAISDDYYESAFKISRIVTFNEGNFFRLGLEDGSFVGYVHENMIDLIELSEYERIMIDDDEEYGLSILPKTDLSLQKVPKFDSTFINFVNMGRLSPEKNQKQLISAFKLFNEETPNSRLYILGKGPLESELVAHIHELEMEGKVLLLGHISTPFEFMKLNSYFILPSFYEGQPMVLLESLTIGMKIIASNIPANINVVGEDERYGLLTEGTDVKQIYDGMIRGRDFKGNFEPFNYEEYNKDAIDNFYREIL